MKMKNLTAIAAAATLTALSLSACGGGDPLSSSNNQTGGGASSSIVVGSADFPESQLIAKIYAEALRAKNVAVQEKPNIGSREVTIPALKDGSIDLMPEYSGSLLQYLDTTTKAASPEDVAKELTAKMPAGLTQLTQSNAQDKDVLTVKKDIADKYSLKTIGDLARRQRPGFGRSAGVEDTYQRRRRSEIGVRAGIQRFLGP